MIQIANCEQKLGKNREATQTGRSTNLFKTIFASPDGWEKTAQQPLKLQMFIFCTLPYSTVLSFLQPVPSHAAALALQNAPISNSASTTIPLTDGAAVGLYSAGLLFRCSFWAACAKAVLQKVLTWAKINAGVVQIISKNRGPTGEPIWSKLCPAPTFLHYIYLHLCRWHFQ